MVLEKPVFIFRQNKKAQTVLKENLISFEDVSELGQTLRLYETTANWKPESGFKHWAKLVNAYETKTL